MIVISDYRPVIVRPKTDHQLGEFSQSLKLPCILRNISCVLHLGDITNHNRPAEWENAVTAMQQLDGKVPYFMVPGNHDYSEKGDGTYGRGSQLLCFVRTYSTAGPRWVSSHRGVFVRR
jgi:predicted phosphodiesterase